MWLNLDTWQAGIGIWLDASMLEGINIDREKCGPVEVSRLSRSDQLTLIVSLRSFRLQQYRGDLIQSHAPDQTPLFNILFDRVVDLDVPYTLLDTTAH